MAKNLKPHYIEAQECRIEPGGKLETILSLGTQALTGVFPKSVDELVPEAPLELCWSPVSGLVQLRHTFEAGELYGDNYGYRSGLNPTMVDHLMRKVEKLDRMVSLEENDVVVDIGANDGTLLNAFAGRNLELVGFDPVAKKFRDMYESEIVVVEEFFDDERFSFLSSKKAKLVTSIAMFYDLESPRDFVQQIANILDVDGVWHFEQSYLPSMLQATSYDTICHEHLEYYSLTVVCELLNAAGLKIIDVETNSTNGGSFAVTAALKQSLRPENKEMISWFLGQEKAMGLQESMVYDEFAQRVRQHRDSLVSLIHKLNSSGATVAGYGASTKGNVLLQFCEFGSQDIKFIGDVNPYKHGRVTPGSRIPIVSEEEMYSRSPDYLLVLPWHFRDFIVEKEANFLRSGGKLIFPLPKIEII